METLGLAILAEHVPAERAISAVVSRTEIANALTEDSSELLLEVDRQYDNGNEERSTISMSWSRVELEKLLERATSDNVVLTFDRDELSQAMGDVEAHGLRERALVFTVAAAGALGTGATIANAMPTGDPGGPAVRSAASALVTDVSSTGGYAAPATAPESGPLLTDASSGGGYAAPATAPGGPLLTDASSGGGYAAPATTTASDSMLTDVSSGGGYPVTPEAGSSAGLFHAPSPLDTGIAGGIAIAIAAAAFTSRRGHTPRPA
jgi:hypothetical protein